MEYKYDPILCMNIPVEKKKTRDAGRPLSKMNMNELRQIYVDLGGDIKRTYGTSKQAMILKIDELKRAKKQNESKDSISSIDKAIKACDDGLTEWLVSGEDDETGKYRSWTTRKATKEEAKREAEKMGLSNVQVRKY